MEIALSSPVIAAAAAWLIASGANATFTFAAYWDPLVPAALSATFALPVLFSSEAMATTCTLYSPAPCPRMSSRKLQLLISAPTVTVFTASVSPSLQSLIE